MRPPPRLWLQRRAFEKLEIDVSRPSAMHVTRQLSQFENTCNTSRLAKESRQPELASYGLEVLACDANGVV